MGLLGALIEQGLGHRDAWSRLGVPPFKGEVPIEADDLYPDALACLEDAKGKGLIVGVAGNQPDEVCQRLTDLGFKADFIVSSADWGASKPSPVFFDRVVDEAGVGAGKLLYVGDRVDNDVLPAHRAGMRTAFLMRGPCGHIHAHWDGVMIADLRVESLDELRPYL